MVDINSLVWTQKLMEAIWVKNKKSGRVHQVQNFNPDLHVKLSEKEVEKEKESKERAVPDSEGLTLSDVIQDQEFLAQIKKKDKQLASALKKVSEGKKVSNKKELVALAKSINTDNEEWSFEVEGKTVSLSDDTWVQIKGNYYAAKKTETEFQNRFGDLFQKQIIKRSKEKENYNVGEAAEEAYVEALKAYEDDPASMPIKLQKEFAKSGLDASKPFKIEFQGGDKPKGEDTDGKEVSLTSKADIVIKQGNKVLTYSVKYTGGNPATYIEFSSSSKTSGSEKLEECLDKLVGNDSKWNDEFRDVVDNYYSYIKKKTGLDKAETMKRRSAVTRMLRSENGRRFLKYAMSLGTPTAKHTQEEGKADNMLIINDDGSSQVYNVDDYIEGLQNLGVGDGGSGIILDRTSTARGFYLKIRSASSNLEVE